MALEAQRSALILIASPILTFNYVTWQVLLRLSCREQISVENTFSCVNQWVFDRELS